MMQLAIPLALFFAVEQATGKVTEQQPQESQPAVAARLPVPDDTARAKALKIAKQVFGEDYRDRKAESRRTLVLKLLKQADDPANDPAMQYVLLTEAARIAAETGDVNTALDSATKKALRFKDDPSQLKLDVLSAASKATTSPEDQTSLIDKWISLANEAASAEAFDVAEKAARGAYATAVKTKNKELVSRTSREQQRIRTAGKLFAAMVEGRTRLKANPDDPDAYLALGKYVCFVRGRWDDGLPHLARVDDVELKAAAKSDLVVPKEPREQAAVGDRWCELAKQEKDARGKASFQARARYWYNLALPGLAGMEQAKVESRLAQVNEDAKSIPRESDEGGKKKQTASDTARRRRETSSRSVAWLFSKQHFDDALKTGHGKWSFERDGIAVHSWTYGFPGLLIFGNDTNTGSLRATMKNGGYAANGCQGLVMCLTKEVNQDDGYHGSSAYFVRYIGGTVELLDAIPYHKSPHPPKQLASAPGEVKDEAFYILRMSVRDGDTIDVWLNQRKVLEYTATRKLRGKYGLLASNGQYIFQNVTVETSVP